MALPAEGIQRQGVLAAIFILVHGLYLAAGVRFDHSSLIEFMQFLDPELLRTRLFESLWFLHIQPPLFNAFLGLGLKLDPSSQWFFPMAFYVFGFVLFSSTDALLRRMGVGPGISLTLAVGFMASPGFILWEHFLLYEFLCASLLAASAVSLHDYAKLGKTRHLVLFTLCVVSIAMMRSLFHLGYIVIAFGALMAVRPRWWRKTLSLGLVALALVGSVYLKNLVVFGEFTACTFVEKNLWIMTAGNIGWQEKQERVARGEISSLSLVNRWAGLEAYPPEYAHLPDEWSSIPALSESKKSNGAVNYNHAGHIAICKVYGDDAKTILRLRPEAYVAAVAISAYRYFAPTSSPPVSPENKANISLVTALYDHVVLLKLPDVVRDRVPFFAKGGIAPHVTLILGLPLLVAFGIWTLMKGLASRPWPILNELEAGQILLAFGLFNIGVVAVLGCALDFHETARYRFLTDAFYLMLAGMVAEVAWKRWKHRGQVP